MIYLSYTQRFTPSLTVVAGTSIDPERTALALLTAGRELDPDPRVLKAKTMERHLALMRLPQQLSAVVLSAFGGLALALAAVGLYGRGELRRRPADARDLGGLLFDVDALDPLTFVGVPLVLGAAALFAAYLPARRASRVSPVVALRTD